MPPRAAQLPRSWQSVGPPAQATFCSAACLDLCVMSLVSTLGLSLRCLRRSCFIGWIGERVLILTAGDSSSADPTYGTAPSWSRRPRYGDTTVAQHGRPPGIRLGNGLLEIVLASVPRSMRLPPAASVAPSSIEDVGSPDGFTERMRRLPFHTILHMTKAVRPQASGMGGMFGVWRVLRLFSQIGLPTKTHVRSSDSRPIRANYPRRFHSSTEPGRRFVIWARAVLTVSLCSGSGFSASMPAQIGPSEGPPDGSAPDARLVRKPHVRHCAP